MRMTSLRSWVICVRYTSGGQRTCVRSAGAQASDGAVTDGPEVGDRDHFGRRPLQQEEAECGVGCIGVLLELLEGRLRVTDLPLGQPRKLGEQVFVVEARPLAGPHQQRWFHIDTHDHGHTIGAG